MSENKNALNQETTLANHDNLLKNKILKEVSSIRGIALIVSFTALVFLSTSIFFIYIPASNGFFNIGEAFVYLAALIGGPVTGAIAGGLGASMADLALGFGLFAPATAVLKALEGFVVGLLFHYSRRIYAWLKYVFIGIVCSFLIGFSAFLTNQTFIIRLSFYGAGEFSVNIPGYAFLIISILLSALIIAVLVLFKEKGEMALSCSLGGVIIVIGYYLYEIFILGYEADIVALEVPFNIAQVIFGAAIAIPIVSYLRELGVISSDFIEDEAIVEEKIQL